MLKLEPLVAEFIGTFTLIFAGIGAIAAATASGAAPGVGLVGIALAHGIAIAIMVSATAAVSGGHLNPAVTVGALVGGKIKPVAALGYIVMQCLGGITAAMLLYRAMPADLLSSVHMGIPALGTISQGAGKPLLMIQPWMAVILEAVLTFFLVFIVFGTAIDNRAARVGGLYIGLAVTMGVLVAGPITGAAMNPARHFGPAVASGQFQDMWIYWVGPLIGGVIAGVIYRFVMEAKSN